MLMSEPQPYHSIDGRPIAVVPTEPTTRTRLTDVLASDSHEHDDTIASCIIIDDSNALDSALAWCTPPGTQSVMFDVDRNAAALAANAVVVCEDGIAGHLDPMTADALFAINEACDLDYRQPSFPVVATFRTGDVTADIDVTDVVSTLDVDDLSVNPILDGHFRRNLVKAVCRYGLVPPAMADPNALEMAFISMDTYRALATSLHMMSDYQRADAHTNALLRILTQVHDLYHWRKATAQNACDAAVSILVGELATDRED